MLPCNRGWSETEQGMSLPSPVKLEASYDRAFAGPIVIAGHLEPQEEFKDLDRILTTKGMGLPLAI